MAWFEDIKLGETLELGTHTKTLSALRRNMTRNLFIQTRKPRRKVILAALSPLAGTLLPSG